MCKCRVRETFKWEIVPVCCYRCFQEGEGILIFFSSFCLSSVRGMEEVPKKSLRTGNPKQDSLLQPGAGIHVWSVLRDLLTCPSGSCKEFFTLTRLVRSHSYMLFCIIHWGRVSNLELGIWAKKKCSTQRCNSWALLDLASLQRVWVMVTQS